MDETEILDSIRDLGSPTDPVSTTSSNAEASSDNKKLISLSDP